MNLSKKFKNLLYLYLSICCIIITFSLMPNRLEPKATLLRMTSPGIGYCEKCGVPWNYVEPHIVMYEVDGVISSGVFYCCEECWTESNIKERILYAIKGFKQHNINGNVEWKLISRAIIKEKIKSLKEQNKLMDIKLFKEAIDLSFAFDLIVKEHRKNYKNI